MKTAETILNELSKERQIYFYDAYILEDKGIKFPANNLRNNPLSNLIMDAMQIFSSQFQSVIDELKAANDANMKAASKALLDMKNERDESIRDAVHLTNRIKNHWTPLVEQERQRSQKLYEALKRAIDALFVIQGNRYSAFDAVLSDYKSTQPGDTGVKL